MSTEPFAATFGLTVAVCVDEFGNPLKFGKLQKHYKTLLETCGFSDEVRFHDLRHSVATYLLELGIPIEEVSAWLGHSSIATTAKVYAHVNIGIRKNAATKMDALLGYKPTENQATAIEQVLSQLFAEILAFLRNEIAESRAARVRTSQLLPELSRSFPIAEEKPFEVSFELCPENA